MSKELSQTDRMLLALDETTKLDILLMLSLKERAMQTQFDEVVVDIVADDINNCGKLRGFFLNVVEGK